MIRQKRLLFLERIVRTTSVYIINVLRGGTHTLYATVKLVTSTEIWLQNSETLIKKNIENYEKIHTMRLKSDMIVSWNRGIQRNCKTL